MLDQLDSWFGKSPGRRQSAIVLMAVVLAFSAGLWSGTRGLSEDVETNRTNIAVLTSQTAENAAGVAENRRDIGAIEGMNVDGLIQTIQDLVFEFCTDRLDRAGSLTLQGSRECRSRSEGVGR